ncbi:shikimate kinase [Nakamurella flava]|uniref:Shikimate kinase n=1 Tax=Nakamurella flava TaxID=2576308 RepID=A0A4U6QLS8_9ACTN|nr:shikimate kinase [Nakamurella flava]TKV61557.1 shikimate kinase [Nakamurella flava]
MTRPLAVLVGPMGSGKTAVGKVLAARLGVALRDTDADIVAEQGRSISDIFTTDGEPVFRALERAAVARAVAEHPGVLSLGGGAVLAPETQAVLGGHAVVLLTVTAATGVRRTGLDGAGRPMLAGVNPRATYRALLAARMPVYRQVATVEVATDDLGVDEVADVIIEKLGLA